MKQIAISYIACLLFSFGIAKAQTSATASDSKALQVLNSASDAYNRAGGINATFSLRVLSKGGAPKDRISGSIQLKGARFKIKTESMTAWFDGTNQWVYIEDTKEVNLSRPSAKDLLTINPVNVFQIYKYGYKCKLLADKTENGKKVFQIEMKPSKKASLQTIVVRFDKINYKPVSATISNKDKSGTDVILSNYQTGQSHPDALFTFNPKNYPNAEVIDLR
jgi:outer membrane lipoprotein-sorting protein